MQCIVYDSTARGEETSKVEMAPNSGKADRRERAVAGERAESSETAQRDERAETSEKFGTEKISPG